MIRPYADSPEALVVALAGKGNGDAFAELVHRHQAWIRGLMLRLCGASDVADDLAQRVFEKTWRDIHRLRQPRKFAGWLKALAINTWRETQRKNDPLLRAQEIDADQMEHGPATSSAPRPNTEIDVDRALQALPEPVRLCVVLAHHEGMTHPEVARATGLPLGTVKSHIRRGGIHLQQTLAAYRPKEHPDA